MSWHATYACHRVGQYLLSAYSVPDAGPQDSSSERDTVPAPRTAAACHSRDAVFARVHMNDSPGVGAPAAQEAHAGELLPGAGSFSSFRG